MITRNQKSSKRRLFRLGKMIEAMEPRRLLAAIINGTAGDDTFIISVGGDNSISLTLNGVPGGVAAPGDGLVEVHGLGGNDSITLLNTGENRFFLFGGLGDDAYIVGNGDLKANILRDVQMIDPAGQGNDTVVVNDLFGGGTSYRTDADSVTIFSLSLPFIALPPMIDPGDGTTILGSNGDDTLDLNSVPGDSFPAKTVFDLGPNDDVVRLGGSQNIVDPGLPSTSSILASGGIDRIIVNDQNPTSPRTDLRFDENGFVGGLRFADFQNLDISAHQLPGGVAQPVTFRGFVSPAPNILITGTASADHVQFGEPAHPITGQNYWGTVSLELAAGNDLVDINFLDAPSSSWTFYDSGLGIGNGPASFFSAGVTNLVMNTTNGPDVFTVQDTPNLWNITLNARGGDDLLRMGTQLDLDDAFDNSFFKFVGGSGTDSVVLDDTQDQLGDLDEYHITDGLITKNDFGSGSSSFDLQIEQVEDLTLQMDHDSNRLFYDLNQYNDVEIFGNNGNDQFFNRESVSTTTDVLATTLCERVIFHGGIGLDELLLNDFAGTGSGAQHVFDAGSYTYRAVPGGAAQTVTFDSFTLLDLTGSNTRADEITISVKPLVADFSVASGGGDDTFIVGGGDLDDSGLMTTGGVTLSAGSGNDNITFDDRLDIDEVGETEVYTLGNLTISKGAASLVYSTFESQTLLVADRVISGQFNSVPVVNINAVSGFLNSTTIVGGLNRGSTVNVGNGSLNNIAGTLNLHNSTSVVLNDSTFATARTYTLTMAGMTSPRPINYINCNAMTLNAGTASDAVSVHGLPANMPLVVNAGNGNDTLTLGGGDISANLASAVTLNGGGGSNELRLNNSADPNLAFQVLTTTTFTDGLMHTFGGMTRIAVDLGPGGSNLAIHSVLLPTTVNGGSGDDAISIGNGSLASGLGTNVTVNGGTGNDSLLLLGQSDGGSRTYSFPALNQFRFGDATTGKVVTFSGLEQATLRSGTGADTIDVITTAIPLGIFSGDGNDAVTVSASTAVVTVDTGPEVPPVLFGRPGDALTVGSFLGSATVVVEQSDAVVGLSVGTASTLRIMPGAVLARELPPGGGFFGFSVGTLDLAGGALLVRDGSNGGPDFRPLLTTGHAGGTWSGTGAGGSVYSSLAANSPISDGVGYGIGSEIAATNLGGFTINPGDTLLRYTLDGDANLDAAVNLDDFTRLAAAFGSGNRWVQGDSNYDSAVNLNDFTPLAANFGTSAGNLARAGARWPSPPSGRFGVQPIAGGRAFLDDVLDYPRLLAIV